jgi:malonyl-CoA O-methyltransferase
MIGVSLKDNRIKKAFSGAARRYDNLTSLQKKIGRSLIFRIPVREHYGNILDVGMGTGYLTHNLTCLYPDAKVIGLDFAAGMVSYARQKYDNLTIIQADAMALPFKESSFDLVVSNSAYQWVDDPKYAFKRSYSVLKENGVLCAAMFARGSLKEWFQSLENSFNRSSASMPVQRLISKDQIYDAISASGFKDIEMDCDVVKVSFADMFDLVKWLKAIGANTSKKQVFIGKQAFTRAAQYYNDNFKSGSGVYASFEVAWIKAKKL